MAGNGERVRCAAKKNQTFLVFTEGSLRGRVMRREASRSSDMDNRIHTDRRKTPTPILSRYAFYHGRRSSFRRREDRLRGGYVDRYGHRLFTVLLWIVVLNIFDAFFTHLILDCGGTELNPVADWAITAFGNHFIVWKLAVIGLGLLVLCLHSKYRIARAAIAMTVVLYSGVVLYQVVLISWLM
jgi:hypothetical protein